MSTETTPQTNSYVVLCANESVQPEESQRSPRLHCELNNQTSEQPTDSIPSAPQSALALSPQQESRLRSDSSQACREEIPPSEAVCMHISTSETNPWPAIKEDGSTDSPSSRPLLEPSAKCASATSVTHGFEVAAGSSEYVAGFSDNSPRSALHPVGIAAALSSHVAESQASLGGENEAPASPESTESPAVSPGVTEASQNTALQSVSAWEAKQDPPQISPETLLEDLPNSSSEDSELQPEHDVDRNLMPCVVFLSGIISLSVVYQEPSALFLIGLLLVLRRL